MFFSSRRATRFSRYLIASIFILWNNVIFAHGLPEFTGMVEENRSSIVNISTIQKVSTESRLPPGFEMPEGSPWGELFKRFNGEEGESEPQQRDATSLGSGFVLSEDGYIMTNHHVVKGAEEIIVRFHDRREFKAELIGSDPRSDIAVLKIDADDLPEVKLGKSGETKVGEWVMAIGSPFGFEHSVSVGIVSAINRSLPNETYVPFIQTDVAINPGNSGGPLFNMEGEVIGVNAQIYSQTGGFMGLSFAIPMDIALEVAEQLKDSGHVSRGWLGVYIQNVDRGLAESFGLKNPKGALVSKVFEDSPASKGGLEQGDVIIKYNDKDITYSSDLPPAVGRTKVGSKAKLTVIRKGDTITKYVTIEALPESDQLSKKPADKHYKDSSLGLSIAPVPDEMGKELNLVGGVLVTRISGGPAKRAGLKRGDVILRLNGTRIQGIFQFRKLVKGLPKGRAASIYVHRQSDQPPIYLALKIPE
ncbi:MAG: DegQ family serine endoprotease [Gammaproteobacteria bacterium]|nr:DegQ family serine endoprotease [Gammaproteobacteria bacterium]